ncbi:thrombospondin type 3 repeat-containing protein, partial [Chryseobacterium sp. 2TAF14]|uniref:thrombospondin type 3 repeat-containing protein n=1 Tax=Chryseobacterium sp. 2TAF14 TaxID=3233007 RepID=UPI003F92664C
PWSDQDKDGVIDKDDACPEVAGSSENNGCLWLDTDGDGILDKDDQCPTIQGLVDHNGCTKPSLRDCTAEEQIDSLEMVKLRSDYKNIDQIYNQLNKKIFDSLFKKYNIKDFALYLKFINWDIHCDLPGCCPNWKYMKYNFLISKFWNKQALENYYNRKDLQYIMFSTKLYPDLIPDIKEFAGTSLYTYLIKFYREDTHSILASKNLNVKNSPLVNVELYFEDPFKIRVIASCNHSCGISDIRYEYNGKIWKEIAQ